MRSFLIAALATLAIGCASEIPNRVPTGEPFPKITGSSLANEAQIKLPAEVVSDAQPTILIIGYVQDAQFDIDRWLLGLLDRATPAKLYEVPAARGLVPTLISDRIDEGMRGGIPSGDWGSVITVYEDADALVNFTGNVRPRNARVMLLDRQGRVTWFHDGGYSARVLLELDAAAREALKARAPAPDAAPAAEATP